MTCYYTKARIALPLLAALITTLILSAAAIAATVNVTGTANYARPSNLVEDMFGTGPVTFDLRFGIGPGTPTEATVSNASGTISWAAPGARQFDLDALLSIRKGS